MDRQDGICADAQTWCMDDGPPQARAEAGSPPTVTAPIFGAGPAKSQRLAWPPAGSRQGLAKSRATIGVACACPREGGRLGGEV